MISPVAFRVLKTNLHTHLNVPPKFLNVLLFSLKKVFNSFRTILMNGMRYKGFPDGIVVKKPPANTEDAGGTRDTSLIPGLGRFSGEGNGNPFQ